jgi:hypothetical protein
VGDLHEQRPPTAEEQETLTVHLARHGIAGEGQEGGVRCQRFGGGHRRCRITYTGCMSEEDVTEEDITEETPERASIIIVSDFV